MIAYNTYPLKRLLTIYLVIKRQDFIKFFATVSLVYFDFMNEKKQEKANH